MGWSLDPRVYRWLWVLGVLGFACWWVVIQLSTYSIVVSGVVIKTWVDAPFWVYPLLYLSVAAFIAGTALYLRYWRNKQSLEKRRH